jgi:hypothetical protein
VSQKFLGEYFKAQYSDDYNATMRHGFFLRGDGRPCLHASIGLGLGLVG